MKKIYAVTVSWQSECLVCAESEKQADYVLAMSQRRLKEESDDIKVESMEVAGKSDIARYDGDYLVLGANEGLDDLLGQLARGHGGAAA
jgi:hypothetical protein